MLHVRRKPGRQRHVVRRTNSTCSPEGLTALAQLVAAGQVMLQPVHRAPVIVRLTAAMTRLGCRCRRVWNLKQDFVTVEAALT